MVANVCGIGAFRSFALRPGSSRADDRPTIKSQEQLVGFRYKQSAIDILHIEVESNVECLLLNAGFEVRTVADWPLPAHPGGVRCNAPFGSNPVLVHHCQGLAGCSTDLPPC